MRIRRAHQESAEHTTERPSAVVCGHMLNSKSQGVGFVENSSDPADLQAWCTACEQVFLAEGDKTPGFLEFNQTALVCDLCYSNPKDRHSIPADI
jgi:hypothetical protein